MKKEVIGGIPYALGTLADANDIVSGDKEPIELELKYYVTISKNLLIKFYDL